MSGQDYLTEDEFLPGTEEQKGAGRGFVWVASVVGLLLVAGAYVGISLMLDRYIPARTTISGVAVGGLTHQQAVAELRRQLGDLESRPVTLVVGATTVTLDPQAAGLRLDLDGSLAGLTGLNLAPRSLFDHIRGGVHRSVATTVDATALSAQLQTLAAGVEVPARDAGISLTGGSATVVPAQAGSRLDVAATTQIVGARWPSGSPIRAATAPVPPVVSDEDAQRVRTDFADPAMSGPVTVQTSAGTFQVAPDQLAPGISFSSDGGALHPVFDDGKILAAVEAAGRDAGVVKDATDAAAVLVNGRPQVRPAEPGRHLAPDGLARAVAAALTDPARSVSAKVVSTPPQVTTDQVRAVFSGRTMATFSSSLPSDQASRANLTAAAAAVNGVWVPPGQAFSMLDHLGALTAKRGYQKAPMPVDGRLRMVLGGGVSQVATGLFNAALLAGLRVNHRNVPTFADARYPDGRDAAVGRPGQDLILSNDTPDGVLIGATVSRGKLTVTFYGTRPWRVTLTSGGRHNVVAPRDITDGHSGCVPQRPGYGFDVTVTRVIRQSGKPTRRDTFTSHYIPRDQVTCT